MPISTPVSVQKVESTGVPATDLPDRTVSLGQSGHSAGVGEAMTSRGPGTHSASVGEGGRTLFRRGEAIPKGQVTTGGVSVDSRD